MLTYSALASTNIPLGTNSPLGIGRATVHQFAQNGAKAIYICDYDDAHLETHKRELKSLYPTVEIHTRKFDASDEAAVKEVVDHAVKTYGRLDIFFANAGIVGTSKVFSEVSAEEFLNTLKVNVVRYVAQILIKNPSLTLVVCILRPNMVPQR